jgi:hypothetical protein
VRSAVVTSLTCRQSRRACGPIECSPRAGAARAMRLGDDGVTRKSRGRALEDPVDL